MTMKKITIVFLVFAFSFLTSRGQAQMPNGSFENWATATWGDSIVNWTSSFKLLSDVVFVNKSTSAKEGVSAAEITSQEMNVVFTTYNIPGILTLGKIQPDLASFSAKIVGGVPFTSNPSTFKGWYQYTPLGTDSAIAFVLFTKWNSVTNKSDTIGKGSFVTTAAQSEYAQFAAEITYPTVGIVPDTMNIILLSSGIAATPGSKFLVDKLSFEYPEGVREDSKLDCYVYPNPSNGVVNVSLANNVKTTATLYDFVGREVYSKSISNLTTSMDFSSLPKGIYLLELKNNTQRAIKKITLK